MSEDGSSLRAAFALRERDPTAPFVLGAGARTWGDLLADAAAIAGALRDQPRDVMVACTDRYLVAASLLALWHADRVAALPPNGSPETIDALCAARGISTVLHDGGGTGGLDVRRVVGEGGQHLPLPRIDPERVLVCVYTSGSTGAHVACRKTAAQILGEARLLSELFGLGPDARVLATVPPHHIYGLLFGVLVPLVGGAAVVRSTPHHAETVAQQAAAAGANVLVTVPAHLHGLGALSPGALPPLGRVFSSGAPLAEKTALEAAALLGTPITEVYGSSETGGIAWRQASAGPAWQPFPGIEVDAGPDGAIVLRSPFAEARPFHGADQIVRHADGRFELRGRSDGVVKIAGTRTSTAEIERRLLEIPGVRDAAVISVDVPGPRQHELWAALVAPGCTVSTLRAALRHWVDPVAIPRRFRLCDELPREENGKLTRDRVQALFASPDAPAAAGEGAAGEGQADQQTVEVQVYVPADSRFFRGHFDGFPVLPGVVQINDLVLRQVRDRWPALRHLRRVTGLKFRAPIRPGDTVAVETTRSAASRVEFKIRRGEQPVSSGVLIFETEA